VSEHAASRGRYFALGFVFASAIALAVWWVSRPDPLLTCGAFSPGTTWCGGPDSAMQDVLLLCDMDHHWRVWRRCHESHAQCVDGMLAHGVQGTAECRWVEEGTGPGRADLQPFNGPDLKPLDNAR
jgi:hypothetical protein